uniref:DUF4007 family protein n=1 Tax=Roseburia sp. TaxID=2049040 RepID=UPI003FEE6065
MAEKSTFRFKGHETFFLREGWLNKGLFAVKADARVFTDNYGADALGVGPNMAKSIRYWMRCAAIIDDTSRNGVWLTELGTLIYENDPYIEDWFTLWLVHCQIVQRKELATAWYLFFNQFSYEEFDKDQLFQEMKRLAKELPQGEQALDASIAADCDLILRMYAPVENRNHNPEEKNVSPFGKLGLLKVSGTLYERKQPDLNHLPVEMVEYLLTELLETRDSIYLEDLLTLPQGPGRLLGLKRTALMEYLEKLEEREIITVNRTAGLDMVYRKNKETSVDVIKKYYESRKKE